jgi:hypothetical protein
VQDGAVGHYQGRVEGSQRRQDRAGLVERRRIPASQSLWTPFFSPIRTVIPGNNVLACRTEKNIAQEISVQEQEQEMTRLRFWKFKKHLIFP